MVSMINSRKAVSINDTVKQHTTEYYVNNSKNNKVTLHSSSTVMGVKTDSIKSGIAGDGGTLSWNTKTVLPKRGVIKN